MVWIRSAKRPITSQLTSVRYGQVVLSEEDHTHIQGKMSVSQSAMLWIWDIGPFLQFKLKNPLSDYPSGPLFPIVSK